MSFIFSVFLLTCPNRRIPAITKTIVASAIDDEEIFLRRSRKEALSAADSREAVMTAGFIGFFLAGVPLKWKHSLVTLLLKKQLFNVDSKYRAISITSVFCRPFEKILKK